jgi:TATA-binding protein-associated factor Taf7
MGRGRAKAKQTKVARELKYSSHGTDLDALQAELSGQRPRHSYAADVDTVVETGSDTASEDDDEYDDPYAAYLDETDEDDDEGDGQRQAR